MIHDPMCRRAKIMESLMEGCPECDLIARVREDERTNEPPAWAYRNGYAAALRDAVEAVKTLPAPVLQFDGLSRVAVVVQGAAVAAIEALGETE